MAAPLLLHKTYRRADGSEQEREVVEHPGSVAVLAHDEEAELGAEEWSVLHVVYPSLDLAQIDEALPQIRDATTVIALLYLKQKL